MDKQERKEVLQAFYIAYFNLNGYCEHLMLIDVLVELRKAEKHLNKVFSILEKGLED